MSLRIPRKKIFGTFAVLLAALALGVAPACSSTDEESSNQPAQEEAKEELDRSI